MGAEGDALSDGRGNDGPEPLEFGGTLDVGECWFVVHTQPKNEARAAENLARQAFKVFFPSMRRTIKHARKTSVVLAPLFPGYLFVALNREVDRWRSINGTRGVIRLITNGEEPVAVPHGIVEDLQRRVGANGALDWTLSLKQGDRVSIVDGPFASFVGTLEHLDASGRIQLLLDLLGRSVRVSVGKDNVAPPSA